MRCQRCQFENIPGQSRCFQCGSVLEADDAALDIHPPRMARWKRPFRSTGRWLRRHKLGPRRPLAEYLPERLKTKSAACLWGPILSIVPGLAHLVSGRFREILLYFIGWLVAVGAAIYLYGTGTGMVLVGLAIALHAWILVQHAILKEFKDIGERILLTIVALVCLGLLYWGVRRWTLPNLTGGYTSLTIPGSNTENGDYFLVWRDQVAPEDLRRGSLVLARLSNWEMGRRYSAGRTVHSMIVQVIGVPGDTVEIREDSYAVNGEPVDPNTYPLPRWLRGRELSAKIKPGAYLVSSEYRIQARGFGNLPDEQVIAMCLVNANDIEGRAFMRWLPISRRGYLEEIE